MKNACHSFYQNTECEFFPCHNGVKNDDFNCLFCYCPLYALGDKCPGEFTFLEDGIKDCSLCAFPHKAENYPKVLECTKLINDPGKK